MLIFLIGFMGCGKSYTAKKLSEMLDIPFEDMDKAIEEKLGMSVMEIFEQKGETFFREQEKAYLESLDANADLIVATGGGAACHFDNMRLMNSKGLTIYLNRSRERALDQLMQGMHKRPLLKGKSEVEVAAFYDAKLKEREPFYQQAFYHAEDRYAEEIAAFIRAYKSEQLTKQSE